MGRGEFSEPVPAPWPVGNTPKPNFFFYSQKHFHQPRNNFSVSRDPLGSAPWIGAHNSVVAKDGPPANKLISYIAGLTHTSPQTISDAFWRPLQQVGRLSWITRSPNCLPSLLSFLSGQPRRTSEVKSLPSRGQRLGKNYEELWRINSGSLFACVFSSIFPETCGCTLLHQSGPF